MRSLTIDSPAKINLYLRVLGRRPDGYHELLTLFHRISLRDTLVLKKKTRPGFRLITNHPELRSQRKNLIYRAWQLLSRATSWEGGVEIRLNKKVPLKAGLGGGSSNAAHFLLGMNRLFNLGLPRNTLLRVGRQVGADVPFFLFEINQAVGRGVGDQITPYLSREKLWFVLLISKFGIPTPRVYSSLKAPALTRISRFVTITSDILGHQKFRNDLFPISSSIRPRLKQYDTLFEQLGVTERIMSGSGPTMVSIHRSKHEAQSVASKIRCRGLDLDVLVCQTC